MTLNSEYFQETRVHRWAIDRYLNFCLAEATRDGAIYDHDGAVTRWLTALTEYTQLKIQTSTSARANKLLSAYYIKGRKSDKATARIWLRNYNRRSRDPPPPPPPPPPPLSGNIIFTGPVNHGDFYDSTLTQTHSSGLLRGDRISSQEAGLPSNSTDHIDEDDEIDSDDDDDCESVLGDGAMAEASQTGVEKHLQAVSQFYEAMVNPFKFSTGKVLEVMCNKYAMSLKVLQPVHFGIVDPTMKTLFEDSEWSCLKDQSLPGPCFPKYLDDWLKRYDGITTTDQCRKIVHASYASADKDDREMKDDKNWIDDVVLHYVQLIVGSHGLLSRDMPEGVWDSLVHGPGWDKNFARHPWFDMWRKEILSAASKHALGPFVNPKRRYDCIVRLRPEIHCLFFPEPRPHSCDPLEFAVFEVSRPLKGVVDSNKWKRDREKVLSACHAKLCRLRNVVDNDVDTVKQLKVIGVLQAGRWTQIYVASCVGHNIVFLTEGTLWELPLEIAELKKVYNLISAAWKCKKIIIDCATTVKDYLERKKNMNQDIDRTAPDVI